MERFNIKKIKTRFLLAINPLLKLSAGAISFVLSSKEHPALQVLQPPNICLKLK
jgi:hypothetical protein|tara:strand:- start:836 stop:997 length:162 start_codon:yes stop_codon:yes gene_type:complete